MRRRQAEDAIGYQYIQPQMLVFLLTQIRKTIKLRETPKSTFYQGCNRKVQLDRLIASCTVKMNVIGQSAAKLLNLYV